MRQPPIIGLKPFLIFAIILLSISSSQAQSAIDWSKDTVSKADAMGGRSTYLNTVRGSGQLATEQIKLPVNKMKEILDACAANYITDVTVMIVTIRQADLARFYKNNPEISETGGKIKGRQMLVFKVPRKAFAGAKGAKVNLSNTNPLMVSLTGIGLMLLDNSYLELPAGDGDVYFGIGSICPPPASCDD